MLSCFLIERFKMKKIKHAEMVYLPTLWLDILETMLVQETSISNFTAAAARGQLRFTPRTADRVSVSAAFRRLEKAGAIKRVSSQWDQYYVLRDRTRTKKIVSLLKEVNFFGLAPEEHTAVCYGSVFLNNVGHDNMPIIGSDPVFKKYCAGPQYNAFFADPKFGVRWQPERPLPGGPFIYQLDEDFVDIVSTWDHINELWELIVNK